MSEKGTNGISRASSSAGAPPRSISRSATTTRSSPASRTARGRPATSPTSTRSARTATHAASTIGIATQKPYARPAVALTISAGKKITAWARISATTTNAPHTPRTAAAPAARRRRRAGRGRARLQRLHQPDHEPGGREARRRSGAGGDRHLLTRPTAAEIRRPRRGGKPTSGHKLSPPALPAPRGESWTACPPPSAPSPLTGGRLAAVVAGAFTALLAVIARRSPAPPCCWAYGQEGRRRLLPTDRARIATPTTAIVSDDLDVHGVPLGESLYGKVRLRPPADDGKPVFAGIARTRDVDAYLRGTAHSHADRPRGRPVRALLPHRARHRTPARPRQPGLLGRFRRGHRHADRSTWKVEDGDYSVVLMNADGSPRHRRVGQRRGRRPDRGRPRLGLLDRRPRPARPERRTARRRPAAWHS